MESSCYDETSFYLVNVVCIYATELCSCSSWFNRGNNNTFQLNNNNGKSPFTLPLPPQPNSVHFKLKSNFHGQSLFHTFVPLARLIPLNTKCKFKDHNCVFANDASSFYNTYRFLQKNSLFPMKMIYFILVYNFIYIYDWILK